MLPKRGEQGGRPRLGSKGKTQKKRGTILPPRDYIILKEDEQIETPNLISIYKQEYKAKHFQFGTSLATETYREELEKSTRHCNKVIRDLNLTGKDLQWVGDTMQFSEEWPMKSDVFRIAQLNVNGLSFAKDSYKIDMYLQGLMAFQVDVATMQEINLNMNKSKIREKFIKSMKRFDQRATIQSAFLRQKEENTYLPGGTAVYNNGVYTGRVQRKGQDKYGRWAYTVLLGKKMSEIMIISAYNTCKDANEDGGTIAGQLRRAMHEQGEAARSLRNSFYKDLQKFLIDERRKGVEIVLAMDANTIATAEELKTLRFNTGMRDMFEVKHPDLKHPRTYFRGQNCLDYIYATDKIARGMVGVGYAPFYIMGKYDHRMMFIDIKWDSVFKHKPDRTQARGRQLSVKNRRITQLYTKIIKKLEQKAGVYQGIENTMKLMESKNLTKEKRNYCVEKLKKYKTVMMQLMVCANKQATKSKPGIFKWSVALKKNGQQMRYWNQRKKSSEQGDEEGLNCKIPKGYIPAAVYTHDDIMEEYYKVQATWLKTKDTSALLHHQYMIDLIEHIESKRGVSKETARKYLYHQEASRAGHQRQSKYLKQQKKGLLTELLVPSPHSQDPHAHTLVTDEESIEKILLRRNKTKLCEAKVSPFCQGPLANTINENGKCAVAKSIVEGRYDLSLIDTMDIEHKMELKMIMKELVRKRNSNGYVDKDVDVTISVKDFQTMFQNKRETTSCGPFGMIMPHWKIMAEDDRLSAIQAKLMEAPFRYGFTYKEWEVSVHCMLLKDDLPYYHRLRIIQLFEGDLNGALQLLFGKRQMKYMEENGLNSDATYGGRKGRGCHQALNRIQYTTLYSRTMRQPLGLVDVDATGCFDRMVGRLLSIINQSNGMSQEAAACQAEVLHNMKHYVKTTRGISENYIQRDETTLLEGNGQGNAASVPGWHGHNELLCRVYKKLIQGSTIMSPDKKINFQQWISSFIDDNKMLLSFNYNESLQQIITTCQRSLQLWETLLNLTGGAVELKKCAVTILQYESRADYSWYNKRPGLPRLIHTNDENVQCIITREGEKGVEIKKQDITEGVRLLGIKAAANGTYRQDFEARLNKSRELAGRLTTAPLNIGLSWQAYYSRWRPAITYCLPITTFTKKECMKIQSPFYTALLPKLGLNRHMPRDLLYGPPQVAGIGLVNLEAEQLAMHVSGLITQIRKRDRVGQTMIACVDALQIYLGIEEQFFLKQAHTYEHRPRWSESQLVYVWEEMNHIGCTLISNQLWTPKSKGENDQSIIEGIINTKKRRQGTTNHLPKQAIWISNACRLFLKVTMLHEISTSCGKYIHAWAMDGSAKNETELVYPHQDKPPPAAWKIWRECILASFLKRSELGRPTLHNALQFRSDNVATNWRTKIRRGMRLEDAVLELPGYMKEALGNITFPIDNGVKLSMDLQHSSTRSWTDGSVKDNIGAHAYTIRTENDNEKYCMSGSGGTPGDINTLTSLRAEHYGILVIVICLDILTLVHGNNTRGTHYHYTDSKAVVTRLNETQYWTDRQYDATDYDIWKETEKAIEAATLVDLNIQHVKAHQREELYNIRKEQGPLTREATYNDWCDGKAEDERAEQQKPAQLCFIDAACIYVQTSTTLITASAYKAIYDMKTRPAAEDYVCRKLGLTAEDYNLVNWEALGHYCQMLAISQKIKVMKYIYDWQNVGTQKQLYKGDIEEDYLCPYKCGKKEEPMHYLTCKESFDNMSIMCMEAINKWMIKVRTNNGMRVNLMQFFYTKLPVRRPGLHITYPEPDKLDIAIREQEQLGWNLTMKGLLSKTWGEIQEREYMKIRERENLKIWYTGTWWMKHLIKHLVFWALNEWQKRNEQLHKNINERDAEKKRKRYQAEIIELYDKQELRPIPKLRRYFRIPLIEKLQQNPAKQRQWIASILALSEKTAMQNSKNRP